MSLLSMTGFAALPGRHSALSWVWELKSVNGKSLDVRLRLPPGFEALEGPIREMARQSLRRGSVQATLQLSTGAAASSIRINETALEAALQLAESLRVRLNAPAPTVEGILALPGIIVTGADALQPSEMEARNKAIATSFQEALVQLEKSRATEGGQLGTILAAQLVRIRELTEAARLCPARAPEAQRRRLEDALARILGSASGFDEQRLHQEAVLMAARADVQEEIDRLFAHVDSATILLTSGEPAGRKLDFLSQEFNREANTLCSKSSDKELTAIGLELKSVIDQFREQVQNIE
jgi:uncharacterized protein (TIGR00255 family)